MSDKLDKTEVRRTVYDAAQELVKAAAVDKRGLTVWNLAEEKRDLSRDAGDDEKADFWHEVYEYLMTLESVAADVEIKIID